MTQRFKVGDKVLYGDHIYNGGRSEPLFGEIVELIGKTMYGVKRWHGNIPAGYTTRIKDTSVIKVPENVFEQWVETNGFK